MNACGITNLIKAGRSLFTLSLACQEAGGLEDYHGCNLAFDWIG